MADGNPRPSGDSLAAIAERCRQLRESFGLNQVQFVAFIGGSLTKQDWNNWEKGRNPPGPDKGRWVALRTGVTYEWLRWGDRGGLPLSAIERLAKVGA